MKLKSASRKYFRYGIRLLHREGSLEKKRPKRKIDCDWPWKGVAINWDGSVSPCCAVYGQKDDFGNIFEQKFQAIWDSNQYRASRLWLSKRSLPEYRTVCYRCSQHGFLG